MNGGLCEKCGVEGVVIDVGSASGRKHRRCPKCGAQWREKNLAAAALGALGGRARAASLSPEERSEIAEKGGEVFASLMRERKLNQ